MSKPRQRGLVRRSELIDAAHRLFFQRGYRQTSIQQLIDAVGLSKGAFYHHFASKQQLLCALTDDVIDRYRDTLMPLIDQPAPSAIEQWNRLMHHASQWKLENKTQMQTYAALLYSAGNLELRHQMQTKSIAVIGPLLAEVIEQGRRQGQFHLDDAGETAEQVLLLLQRFSTDFCLRLLQPDPGNPAHHRIKRKLAATQTAIERLLGAPPDSLPLMTEEEVDLWLTFSDEESP
ncbi:DNA-binding transcriptional regulator, AcrR family [Ferrimonas sediminum]|uniref:DNA-binding transcriptional regulator, AcrR family n=1 Tax=Ferrimonas sediminum TaxID=718193 RepID=A0A1G8VQ09_9GAMM|nr:TetR/AcrR family transcriptional regulator [Ferrimonas sediminum]SDJ67957.1 DNA-binding transcriptional regulator, AcrR family [Ferrimonas sediminum]